MGSDHVGQPEVGEHQPYRDVADSPGRWPGRAARASQLSDALLLEDGAPREDLDQVARPQRQQHADDQQPAGAQRRDARHVVRDREGRARRSVTVTSRAMPMVRRVMVRYTALAQDVREVVEAELLARPGPSGVERPEALTSRSSASEPR